jgi:hypothetical protein
MNLIEEKLKRFTSVPQLGFNPSKELKNAILKTFDVSSKKLPSNKIIQPYKKKNFKFQFFMDSFYIRELYLEHAFVAYTDEMLTALKKFCDSKQMKTVHELCCGTGWFSHWMKKYGIPLKKATDNKTWSHYKNRNNFMSHVIKRDAVQFTRNNKSADMFILSWPYMDSTAARIWKAMKPGQYLLYIGEREGGCTANSEFFNLTRDCQIIDDEFFNAIENAFVQFEGLHDRPELYLKK